MVEMRREPTNSGSNLKENEETSDLTAQHHPVHAVGRCYDRHRSVISDTTDTSPTVQRGQTSR